MPSNRRVKYVLALVALVFVVTLYFTSDARQTRNAEFYKKTSLALEKAATDKRLQAEAETKLEAIIKSKEEIAASYPAPPEGGYNPEIDHTKSDPSPEFDRETKKLPPKVGAKEEVEEQSVAGRKMMPKPKPKWAVGKDEEVALNGGKLEQVDDPGSAEAKEELNLILKKSPGMFIHMYRSIPRPLLTKSVIIFSKSYCPYSKKAKALLLETYKITPPPYVVELDTLNKAIPIPGDDSQTTTLGRKLQDLLAEITSRKTVPNILINGRSIGGSDELTQLHKDDELLKKIRDMGGRWVHEAERRVI